MASGLPKSLPPCSRKPHGPPPLSEAVYVVPAISQYSRTGSEYCIYKTPLRITEQTSQPSTHHTTEQRVERHSDWRTNNRLIVMELDWFLDTPTELFEERTIQKYFSKKVNVFRL